MDRFKRFTLNTQLLLLVLSYPHISVRIRSLSLFYLFPLSAISHLASWYIYIFSSTLSLFLSLSCGLSLPPHCFTVMMQLLFIHQGPESVHGGQQAFLGRQPSHFLFWTRHHQSSAWLQLGLIGCISAGC